MEQLKRLIREAHRRSLWQVLAIYVGASWVVFEVVQTVTEGLGLPPWFPAFAALLLLMGLPIVLATAFVQEGISPTRRADPTLMPAAETESVGGPDGREGVRRLFTWRNALLGGMAAFALWGMLAAGWIVVGGLAPTERGVPTTSGSEGAAETGVGMGSEPAAEEGRYRASVAVLPFENMGAADDLFLSDGMTEEIIAQLAQVAHLKVISRTSVVALRDANLTLPQIADTLGVEHVLEGSVQRIEDKARITVQLIEAETDAHLWAESYTRGLVDLFEVQEEIARRVAGALVATVPELRTPAASRTENAAAYEAYLKGRQLSHRRTQASLLAAIDAFRRSYELDRDYAPAYAGHAAALTLWVAYRYGGQIDPYRAFGRALALADYALELDPQNAEAYAVQGFILTHVWAPDEQVQASFRRALTLHQSSADIHGWYGHFLTRREAFDRALAQGDRAVELNPVAPGRRAGYAADALAARRYDLALRQARAGLVIEPGLSALRAIAAQALLLQGRTDECLASDLSLYPVLRAACLHSAGRGEEARELVDAEIQAVERGSNEERTLSPIQAYLDLSIYHAWIGDVEGTVHWVDRGFATAPKAVDYRFVKSGLFDRVRGDPRFSRRWEEIREEVWDRVRREADAERERLRATP